MKIKRALPLLMMMGLVAQPALADKKLDEAVDKAQKQLEKGKPEDARKTLEKLASKQSTSPDAQVALCLLYQRLGELDAAMASAQAAAAASASATPALRAEAYATLASLDLRMGSGADALAHATEAQKAQPTALALATLARAHARVGASSAAFEAAEKAIAADANSMPAHEAMGEALAELGKGEEAISAFRKALEVGVSVSCTLCNANVVELAKTRLAATLIGEGKTAEAVILAQEASESDPQLGEAFAVLGTATLADDPKNSAKWSEAIGYAQQGAFVDARNPLVRMAVAGIFEAAGNLQQAEAAYKMALQADPAYAPARAALVHARVRGSDLDGALAEAQKLVADAPGSGDAQFALGRTLLLKNDFAGAVEPLAKAHELLPGSSDAAYLLARAAQAAGKPAQAAEACGRAVALDPTNVGYREFYGLLLGMAGQHEEGIAELKKVIETPGYQDTAGHTNLGYIYRSMSKPEESLAAYRKALELDPKNAQAALGMGWANFYADGWDEAIQSFQLTMQIDPSTTPDASMGLAWCHYFKRDVVGARSFMETAREAGRNVSSIEEAIAKYEKAVAENEEAAAEAMRKAGEQRRAAEREAQLINTLRSGSSEARVRAARSLGSLGSRAVDALIWALQEEDRDVRLAAAITLGNIGPAARSALPNLKHLRDQEPEVTVNQTREGLERELKDADVKRAAREAIPKIER